MTKIEIQEYNTKALEEMKHCRTRAFDALHEGDSNSFQEWMRKYDQVKLISFEEATDK